MDNSCVLCPVKFIVLSPLSWTGSAVDALRVVLIPSRWHCCRHFKNPATFHVSVFRPSAVSCY